jgi:hypothetical protein
VTSHTKPNADRYQLILRRFRNGELTREQAEAEGKVAGFPTLEFQPDPAGHNPLKEYYWTLPITLEWIIYRSIDRVRRLMESFRAGSLVWRSITQGASEQKLLPPFRKSVVDIVNDAEEMPEREQQEATGIEARDDLMRRLKAGDLESFGIRPGETEHSSIPSIAWETITSLFADLSDIQADDVGTLGVRGARYQRVRVLSSRVQQIWPELASSAKAASDCRKWLCVQMRVSPDHRPKSKRRFYDEEAKKIFPGLSWTQFETAWTRAIDDTGATAWANPGRPKKIKSPHLLKSCP